MSPVVTPLPSSLRRILDADRRDHSAWFKGGLTNHLPMSVIAAHAMGVDEDAVVAFAARYAERLSPIAREEADATRAQRASLEAPSGTVHAVGALAPHVFADAFHGLIRTRYALETGDGDDVAAALARWAASPSPFASLALEPPGETPFTALAARLDALGVRPAAGFLITERMAALAASDAFVTAARTLDAGGDDEDFLVVARTARALYATVDDFIALHALTGTEAALSLLAKAALPPADRATLYRATAQAVLACLAVAGRPLTDVDASPAPSWSEITRAFTLADDDHLPKLLFTLRVLDAADPDPRWRALAWSRVRRRAS